MTRYVIGDFIVTIVYSPDLTAWAWAVVVGNDLDEEGARGQADTEPLAYQAALEALEDQSTARPPRRAPPPADEDELTDRATNRALSAIRRELRDAGVLPPGNGNGGNPNNTR